MSDGSETQIVVARPTNIRRGPIEGPFDAPKTLAEWFRAAEIAIASNMMPSSFKSVQQVLMAWQLGAEHGLNRMASARSICVINNVPSFYGDAVPGLVESKGLVAEREDWFEVKGKRISPQEAAVGDPDDDWVGVCRVVRVGTGREVIRAYGMKDARRAGLLSKDNWKKDPKRMLQMRPQMRAFRDCFPDVYTGLWIAEEVDDFSEVVIEGKVDPLSQEDQQNQDGSGATLRAFDMLNPPIEGEELEKVLGIPVTEWGEGELARLRAMWKAIRDQRATLDDFRSDSKSHHLVRADILMELIGDSEEDRERRLRETGYEHGYDGIYDGKLKDREALQQILTALTAPPEEKKNADHEPEATDIQGADPLFQDGEVQPDCGEEPPGEVLDSTVVDGGDSGAHPVG